MTILTAAEMAKQIDDAAAANPAYQRGGSDAAEQRKVRAERNRTARVVECADEIAPHVENMKRATAAFHALEHRLADIAPARVLASAEKALESATVAGDEASALEAARTLQAIKAGLDEYSIERLQIVAKRKTHQADVAAAMASFEKAADEALRARLAATEKELARAVKQYEAAAQQAYDRQVVLKQTARTYMQLVAAIGRKDLDADANYTELTRPVRAVELSSVWVPNHGVIRPVGR